MQDVVERIKKYKQLFSITSEELSKRSGIPLGTLNKILSSSTKSIKTETLAAIAKGLDVSVLPPSRPNSKSATLKKTRKAFLTRSKLIRLNG